MQGRFFTRRATAGALVAVLALAGAACGDDDDGGSDATTTTGDEGAAGANADYCDNFFAVEAGFNADEPDAEAIGASLDAVEADHPDEVDEALTLMIAAARASLEGDDSATEAPEFTAAQNEAGAFNSENCGADTAEVQTIDYGFQGIPTEVSSGRTILHLANNGAEIHEMVLLRKNEGVTQSFSEIFGLGEEEGGALVTTAGFAFVGEPGNETYLYTDLEPGEYAAACFIPQGATDFAALEALGEDAPPHVTLGMVSEFTVTDGG